MDQAGICRSKAACIKVESSKAVEIIEINMQPFASCGFRMQNRELNDFCRDAPPLKVSSRFGVEQESLIAAVPCNIHKTN
jgi:hypothetical protein